MGKKDCGYISVVGYLLSMYKALGSILSISKRKRKKREGRREGERETERKKEGRRERENSFCYL